MKAKEEQLIRNELMKRYPVLSGYLFNPCPERRESCLLWPDRDLRCETVVKNALKDPIAMKKSLDNGQRNMVV